MFWLGNMKGRDQSEDRGVDGKDIRTHLREIGWEGVNGIRLAQDRDQWRAPENTVMNLQVP
jgi:hypothetical protein